MDTSEIEPTIRDETPETDFTTADRELILRAAALIQEPRQWMKGGLAEWKTTGQLSYCVWGALLQANAGAMFHETGAAARLYRVARNRGFDSLGTFNDDPTTTHADVLSLLAEAAAYPVKSVGTIQ